MLPNEGVEQSGLSHIRSAGECDVASSGRHGCKVNRLVSRVQG
jgi:hypothetical protein